jgi:hypothetical protein
MNNHQILHVYENIASIPTGGGACRTCQKSFCIVPSVELTGREDFYILGFVCKFFAVSNPKRFLEGTSIENLFGCEAESNQDVGLAKNAIPFIAGARHLRIRRPRTHQHVILV